MSIDYVACVYAQYGQASTGNFSIEDDGSGPKISSWNDAILGAQPDLASLESAWLKVVKESKKEEMRNELIEEMNVGDHGYTTVGLIANIKINSSRGDLDNLRNLRDYMVATNQTTTTLRDFDNVYHQVTIDELSTIILELQGHGLWLYQHKWDKESEIDSCTTVDQVMAVTW